MGLRATRTCYADRECATACALLEVLKLKVVQTYHIREVYQEL